MGKHSAPANGLNQNIPPQRDDLIQQYQASHDGALPPGALPAQSAPRPVPVPMPQTPIVRPVAVSAASPVIDDKVPFFGRKQEILRLRAEVAQMSEQIQSLGLMDITQRENLKRQLEADAAALDTDLASKRMELKQLSEKILDLRDSSELQEMGFYDYRNPAEDSVSLQAKLAVNRQKQKDMVKAKTAVHTTSGFTFNNSAAKGRKFLNDMSRMALSLYNAEAENCVKTVKAGNLQTSITRLNRCSERIDRFGKFISLTITWPYRQLRIEELELTARYMQAVQAEKEAERERRAELREQQKAQKELEAEMARLHKEQEHYQNVLAKMKEKGDLEEAAKLEAKLADIDKSINDVDYRAANIRAGYVYVISDVGAFGERMVKIGMTRRLDPMDRVRELSSAAVPFKFDVHALFFSKDAVSLETMLHHEFEDRRVNKVNARKEFYYCTPQEVLDKLKEKDVAVVEYRVEPEAEEYRVSRAIAEKRQAAANGDAAGSQK